MIRRDRRPARRPDSTRAAAAASRMAGSIPSTSIPVSPGRNLAVVLETAAINNRQKKMGYNAAKELLIRLGLDDKMD